MTSDCPAMMGGGMMRIGMGIVWLLAVAALLLAIAALVKCLRSGPDEEPPAREGRGPTGE